MKTIVPYGPGARGHVSGGSHPSVIFLRESLCCVMTGGAISKESTSASLQGRQWRSVEIGLHGLCVTQWTLVLSEG